MHKYFRSNFSFFNQTDVFSSPAENPFAGDVVSPGEVSFTDLRPNHTAVYQCEASNVHGTILANANIDVVGECPLGRLCACQVPATVLRPHSPAHEFLTRTTRGKPEPLCFTFGRETRH